MAEKDDFLVVISHPGMMPGRHGIASPLQNVSSNDQGARYEAITALLLVSTNVDHQCARINLSGYL